MDLIVGTVVAICAAVFLVALFFGGAKLFTFCFADSYKGECLAALLTLVAFLGLAFVACRAAAPALNQLLQ